MTELPPLLRDQRRIDAEHLKLLSIFHFVGPGLALVGVLFLVGHHAIFSTLMKSPKTNGTPIQSEKATSGSLLGRAVAT